MCDAGVRHQWIRHFDQSLSLARSRHSELDIRQTAVSTPTVWACCCIVCMLLRFVSPRSRRQGSSRWTERCSETGYRSSCAVYRNSAPHQEAVSVSEVSGNHAAFRRPSAWSSCCRSAGQRQRSDPIQRMRQSLFRRLPAPAAAPSLGEGRIAVSHLASVLGPPLRTAHQRRATVLPSTAGQSRTRTCPVEPFASICASSSDHSSGGSGTGRRLFVRATPLLRV
mmetsp:Transcript_318/g.671  ORF Transcript_318/g.671 Transcript_318/m.671 type:complete len:224 (-) Transcript_318:251-922(-)